MIQQRSDRPQSPIAEEYAGKWIAWNHGETQIIASGTTYEECSNAALTMGEHDPVFQKVPDIDELFLGVVL